MFSGGIGFLAFSGGIQIEHWRTKCVNNPNILHKDLTTIPNQQREAFIS